MANNVYSYIWIEDANEAGRKALADLTNDANEFRNARAKAQQDAGVSYPDYSLNAHELFPEFRNEVDAEWSGSDYIDEFGAKWCYVDDCDEDGVRFCSAWGYPDGALLKVAQTVWKADPDAILAAVYDDEMPNFFGSLVYANGELYDEEYIDSDNYKNLGIYFWWDEEEDGEEPENFDEMRDESYDKMNDVRDEDIDAMVASLKEEREES